jgi:uncharacterized hydantoinase/oxoprolinase family protein
VADFNMRAVAFAVQAENSVALNGKADTSFIDTSAAITQIAAQNWFASAVMGELLAGTCCPTTATNVTGTVAIAKNL